MDEFHVSRSTVRQATTELEIESILIKKPGKGTRCKTNQFGNSGST